MAEDVSDIRQANSTGEVLAALCEDLGKTGYRRDLDESHVAVFLSRGPKLLVTFETLEHSLGALPTGLPISLDFAEDKNWSVLHLTSHTDSWFRSPAVYEFIDELVDDMFFEDFDQVSFYGSGQGAYGACAFSVAAPGANVLAVAPQATLDTDRAGWDMRFPDAKRLKFNDRYGYAPDMVEGAQKVYILFDPFRPLDHVHASLFQGPNVSRLKCRHFNGGIELSLFEMDVLHQVVERAGNGSLHDVDFFQLLRKRRTYPRYLRSLLSSMMRRNRPLRVAFMCKYVLDNKIGGPFFRKNLAAAKKIISDRGPLPDWLMDQDPPKKVEQRSLAATKSTF